MDNSGELRGLSGQRDDEAACTSASEGLEEGEVEGETLLIVESEDQASVDLSHDQSGDSLNSDVGDEADTSWNEDTSFYCDKCHKWIPSGEPLVWYSSSRELDLANWNEGMMGGCVHGWMDGWSVMLISDS